MIIEVIQFFRIISKGYFYYLPIHFMTFVALPLIIRHFKAKRYVGCKEGSNGNSNDELNSTGDLSNSYEKKWKVSVVVPEYNEELDTFEKCLRSIVDNKPNEIIVVHDDRRDEVRKLAEKHGAKVLTLNRRVGKRVALVEGWLRATGDIIVQVDSDTILHRNAISEILKPFRNEKVVGIQGKVLIIPSKSWLSTTMSRIIELNRDLNNKALNGCLVVVDGRFNAWRRDFLLSVKDDFINEKFLGRKCLIGDDRFLTQRANLLGFKTVYQDTALAETTAPPTWMKFVKQQLRWARSGYKAFFQDTRIGLIKKAPVTYNILQFTYYLAPLSFTFAIIHDTCFTNPVVNIPLWAVIPIAVFGSGLIALIRRLAVGLYESSLKEFFVLGAFGLFIAYPLMLWALISIRNQGKWETR